MSRHSVDTRPEDTRRPLRVGALALAALMLVTAAFRVYDQLEK
ncbi:hypothetical protein [Archangium sp.]|nr:hypothetical protein [Archangium sp.]HYO51271.1 hypothetical protein [Archangium sp.]